VITYLDALPRSAELVVVGGGIVGAATAFYASQAGLRPLLLEQRPALCSLTTPASGGGFRLQLNDPLQYQLVRASVELFLDFEARTGQREYDPRVRQCGYLWLTTSEAVAQRQRRQAEAQRAWGLDDVEILPGDEVRERFPFTSPDVLQARFRQGDGTLEPKRVTMGLLTGATVAVKASCTVTGFGITGDAVTSVQTSLGPVSTGTVVIAAGPLSGPVARLAGLHPPIETIRGHKVVLPDVAAVPQDAPLTVDEDTGAMWRPAFGNGAYALFGDLTVAATPPTAEVPVDHAVATRLLDPDGDISVARLTPFWRELWRRNETYWTVQAGQYAVTPDRRPLLGPTAIAGLFLNAGYSGYGVMTGPGGSEHCMNVVTGKVPADANPFRPDRVFADVQRLSDI
jgi:sarcosine oxidase subunit beta